MIYKDYKEPSVIYHRNRLIVGVYYNLLTIWEYIKSCFGKGYWINEYPWDDKEAWRNEP